MKNLKRSRVKTIQEIAKLNDLNKRILDSAPISIIIIDKKGVITFVNKYFRQISVEKSPLNKSIFKMPFFIREKLLPSYKKLLSEGTPFKKANCVSIDGSEYINIIAIPTKDENGRINGAISMAVDVSETVRAKLKLDELNSQLENKIAEKTRLLSEANAKLEKSLKLRSQFISDAGHELRTPLSIAKLNLEFFKKQFPTENSPSVEILDSIDREINRVADILSDITFFTSIDEESVDSMNMEKIYLNKFLEDAAGRIKSLAVKKNIKVIFKKNKSNPVINGDKIKLEKLFLNIISNSIKYGKKSGWVKIYIEPDLKNKEIKIIISDNGIGIAKKDMPRIFDRFYRTGFSRHDGEGGFGLGLAICKWIVEKHNGKIVAESTAGKGSVFTVSLPKT